MTKKFIVMLLTVCLAVVGMTVMAFADATYGDFTYTYDDTYKTATITGYSGIDTEVTIPSTIDDYTVIAIGEKAFYNNASLTSVIIPDTVTTIGESAFEGCVSLTSIVIPDSVKTISKSTFYECTSLATVTLDSGVETIGEAAFDGCESLTSITIPDSVKTISKNAFYSCTKLASVTLGNSVENIGDSAFACCTSLTSITIPNSVETIGEAAFYYCESLTSITIPDSVETLSMNTFYYCTSLATVTLGSGIETIEQSAFAYCESLTSIEISSSVKTIGSQAFSYCTGLKSIMIPKSVTSIGRNAFHLFSTSNTIIDVYYEGTSTQWIDISVSDGNTNLTNAFIHYNSSSAHTHTHTTSFEWSNDLSTCTATISCSGCSSTKTLNCDVTSATGTTVSCTEDGTEIYTATANIASEAYIESQTVVTAVATGHSYTESWSWAADFSSATLTLTCSDCGDVQTVKATVTSEKDAGGNTVYTATISGTTFTDSKTVAAEKTTTSNSDPFTTLSRIQASYTAVQAAIAKANALNPDDYENFSIVTEAIEAVDWTLSALNQREVNSYAEAIEEAIENLVPAEAVDIEEETIEVIDPIEAGETDSE